MRVIESASPVGCKSVEESCRRGFPVAVLAACSLFVTDRNVLLGVGRCMNGRGSRLVRISACSLGHR